MKVKPNTDTLHFYIDREITKTHFAHLAEYPQVENELSNICDYGQGSKFVQTGGFLHVLNCVHLTI